ncbi:zinc ribbon domain-containing protein [bacterium]|nr:zinc ribbon domain-containing protein [bacterium]
MPTYEYECTKCGVHFNKLQEMSDEPLKTCPECGGKVRRLLGTGAGIIFKGSGFYTTDYKHTHASPSTIPNSGGNRASCDRSAPCCGRGEPCDKSPCSD